MKGAERQTPRSKQSSVKYKIDNFSVNVFVFCLSSFTHWGFGSTTRKIIRVWMFDEDKKKMKNNRRIWIFSPRVCTDCGKGAERQTPNARIVQVFHICSQRVCFRLSSSVRWRLKKRAPPKKVCTVTVLKYMIWTATFVYHLSIQGVIKLFHNLC